MNVADDITRGLNADQLKGRWQHGPDFLQKEKSEWPAEAVVEGKQAGTEKEKRRDPFILTLTQTENDVIDYKRFSNWRETSQSNILCSEVR